MNSKLTLAAVAILMLVQSVKAQDYAFKVLVNKGKNEVKAGTTWQTVKVGSSLKSSDELKVSENSYVGLVHISGKPLEVKQAGKYKIADLAGKVNAGTSVMSKYTDFILSSNDPKSNNMQATGAVHRGTIIRLNLPDAKQKPLIYNDEIIISWDETDKMPAPYVVRLKSMFGDELAKIDAPKNQIRINMNDANLLNEDNIIVTVESKNDEKKLSEDYTLKRLSKADKVRIKGLLQEEVPTQAQEATAMNKLMLAGFYEKNSLFIDAGTQYLEAIALAPDVPTFQEYYQNFLVRNNLKDLPAKK